MRTCARTSEPATRVPGEHASQKENSVIILGIILLVVGALTNVSIVWTIGIVLVVAGAVLYLLGALDRPVLGRRHYF